MKYTKLFTGVVIAAVAMVTFSVAPKAKAATVNTCSITPINMAHWGESFVIKGDQATATFIVNGTGCTMPVTVASWMADGPKGGTLNDQKLFDHATGTFGPGKHTLTVKVPDCYNQLDILEGSSPVAADGTANYDYQNGKIIDGGLRDFKQGGTKKCEVTTTTVVTPPTTTVTPATPAAILPNTGNSVTSLIATAVSTSFVAGIAYQLYQRRLVRAQR